MVPFGGWDMPLSYPTGTVAEHRACRADCVVFDVSHLGTVRVEGTDAFDVLQRTLTNDLGRIGPGRAQYTHLLDAADGSVLDDLIVWWVGTERFDVMPNASNTARVRAAVGGRDVTEQRAVLALAGPRARQRLRGCWPEAAGVGRFEVAELRWYGEPATVAGTGYTGEDGVEIAVAVQAAGSLWDALVAAGAQPAGLGRATPCGSRRACPCTATSSAPGSPHCRPGSAGWWPGASRVASRGATPWSSSGPAGRTGACAAWCSRVGARRGRTSRSAWVVRWSER